MNTSNQKEKSIFVTSAWYVIKFAFYTFLLAALPEWYLKSQYYVFSAIITYLVAGFFSHLQYRDDMYSLRLVKLKEEYFKSAYVWMYFVAVISNIYFYHNAWFGESGEEKTIFYILPLFLAIITGTFVVYRAAISDENKDLVKDEVQETTIVVPEPKMKYVNSVFPTGDLADSPFYKNLGSAWWVSDNIKNTLTDIKDDKPSYRGLWLGGGFFHHKEGNLITVAPPGTGKGAALIIPNLLWERNYKHSFVVFDPKGTNACITARFQKESQGKKVVIIDPMGLQELNNATHGIPAADFNPLDHIHEDLFNGTAQIANLLIPDDPNAEKYWNQDARNLIQGVLLHIMTSNKYSKKRNLIELYRLMIAGDILSLFEEMVENNSLDGVISDNAESFTNMLAQSEKTFSSIRSVVNSGIKWLSNPALQKCMKKSSFKPEELEEGNIAIYLCQPIHNKEGFASFSRLVVGFCLRANSRPSSKPKAWVYYLLDEFPTMGVFPEVIESLAYSREYKMRIWLFAQSLSQIDIIYKTERRNEICGSAGVFQAFSISDHITQEYVSKRIGNKTQANSSSSKSEGFQEGTNRSTGGGGGHSTGRSSTTSINETFHTIPLISPEALQYDPNIITITEWGPMRLHRWQYWQFDRFDSIYSKYFNDGRADKNPNISINDEDEAL